MCAGSVPSAGSVAIVSIDGHFLRGDYDAALEAIDHVDASVGGDPYLDLLRANVHLVQGHNDAAKPLLRKVIAFDPARPEAYFALADLALADKQWGEMVKLLEALEAEAGQDMSGVAGSPDFTEFMASEPGSTLKTWSTVRLSQRCESSSTACRKVP